MKMAILCPVHRDVQNVAAQIDNYYTFHGEQGFHLLHVSRAADAEMLDVVQHLKFPAQVYLNTDSWETSFRSVLGAILANAMHLRESIDDTFTHVYLHTDGDRLLQGNLLDTVSHYGNAVRYGRVSPKWPHLKSLLVDQRCAELLARLDLGVDDALSGRIEGAFFERAVWEQMVDIMLSVFSMEDFEDTSGHWPREEVVIPTVARFVLGPTARPLRPIVRTKELKSRRGKLDARRDLEENLVQVDDILSLVARHDDRSCIGLKWFSRDPSHPAQELVQSLTKDSVS